MAAVVYLFTGPEIGQCNDEIEALRKKARSQFGQLDEYSYYTLDTRVVDVVSQLQNENLFSDGTFIVLRNVELIKKKDDIEALLGWIKSDAAASKQLILVSEEFSVDKKLEGAIPKSNRKIFYEMFENRKEEWLFSFFKKAGYSVTPDAVEEILSMVENNTQALRTECSRFFMCFPEGHQVTVDDVTQILEHNRQESAFTLFEAMADGNESPAKRLENSLAILQKLRLSGEGNGVALISGLSYSMRMLYNWHQLHAQASSPSDLDLKKNGFASKTMQNRYRSAARTWGIRQTAALMALLAKKDMEIRSSGSLMEEHLLQMMLYEIIIKNGAYAASWEEPL